MIFPDFSAFHRPAAGAAGVPPVQSPVQLPVALPEAAAPEPANRSSPGTGAAATGPAASGPQATSRTRKGRPAAPPFSWLGVDAWPHFPAWADKQA
ncbi:hypothetical protein ACFVTM_02155 [Arthrobacter sp. NPDC058130]|uniref:hypothetical protein n=1 Tax=Arthrobacter sp. NPDC058130 TaxID=3346353 RepID=UPI0036EDDB86